MIIRTQKPRSGDEAGLPKNVASADGCCGDTSLTDRHQFAKRERSGAIIAVLSGSDTCTALGLTAQSSSPVIGLCRKLIEAGYDPHLPLHVFRGDTLALIVHSIGQAANLEVNGKGIGFVARRAVGTAPPIAPNAPTRARHRAARRAWP